MEAALLELGNRLLAHPLLDVVMVLLSSGGFLLLPCLGIYLWAYRGDRAGIAILFALVVGLLLTLVLQALTLRPRPEGVRLLLPVPPFSSYPSGHAVAASATAAVIVLTFRSLRWRLLALGTACLIMFSRLYLGHHYPSDLWGGAMLGSGIGVAAFGFTSDTPGNVNRLRWLFWPQLSLNLLAAQMAYLGLLSLPFLAWPFADKVLHFTLFGLITFWLTLWFPERRVQVGPHAFPVALLGPLLFTLLDEAFQYGAPGRSASLADMASNLAGIIIFWRMGRRLLRCEALSFAGEQGGEK